MRSDPDVTTHDANRLPCWDWVQFVCAFGVAAFVAFLDVNPNDSLVTHLAKTVALALPFAFLAGRFGDAAWSWIVATLQWL